MKALWKQRAFFMMQTLLFRIIGILKILIICCLLLTYEAGSAAKRLSSFFVTFKLSNFMTFDSNS